MYARVARFSGSGDAIRSNAEEIKSRAASGPPEGVPSTGFTLLIDTEKGEAIGIGLFETEEDLRKGDETLNSMSPSDAGMQRVSVETYEVAVDVRN
jgi:hypothetical protein